KELGGEITQKAAELKKITGRAAPLKISAEIGALALHKASSDADYLNHFVRLLRYRDAFDTYDFDIPRRPGPFGAIMAGIKNILWKLLRYQHDRIAFRQNLINGLFTNAVEFEMTERKRTDDELARRLNKAEALLNELTAERKGK
ncbi:MAG: hypothetical protein Q7J98_10580, partial [Kiritimatiellia bacterium]|nr:hypothetical protein [Kiritimatiellia bacterium]